MLFGAPKAFGSVARPLSWGTTTGWICFAVTPLACGAAGDPATAAAAVPELPSLGLSIVRLLGAFALVVVVGLVVVWLLRHGIRFVPRHNTPRKLKVLEMRMLGQRQSLFVVGYEEQRLLLGSSAAGVTFLAHLPAVAEGNPLPGEAVADLTPTFSDALQQALGRRS